MGLTRREIVDAVIKGAFDEADRADAETWVNGRLAWLWDAHDWTFKRATGAVTFTDGSQVAAGPADVHAVYALYDANGVPLRGIRDLRKFFDLYNTNLAESGSPEAYTVVNGQILIGPQGDGTTGLLIYEKAKPAFADDTDETGLPDGYELGLVHGGKAEGFKLTNIPLAANFDADFTAYVAALENNWLEEVKETGQQTGAYKPGQWPAYR